MTKNYEIVPYEAPQIEIIELMVERGFQASFDNVEPGD